MRKLKPKKRITLLLCGALLAALAYQVSAIASTGAAAASTDNQYAFYVGGNHHVYEAVYDAAGWHAPIDMCGHGWGCDSVSAPGVAVNPSNHNLYAYFVAGKGDIYEAFNQSGRWHAPIDMCTRHHWGCGVGSEPDVGVGDDGNQYVFFLGGNNHVYEAVYDATGWHGGYDLCSRFSWGCSALTPPSVAVNPSNDHAYVFFQGRNGDIYEAWNVLGAPLRGWYGPLNMCTSHHWGCGVSSPPDVGVGDDGNQYVFYRGGNDRTYEAVHDSSGWHGGYDLCGRYGWNCSLISAPNAAVNPSNDHAFLFFLGSEGDIHEAWNVSGTPLRGWYGVLNMCTSHHWGCGVLTAPDLAVSP